MGSFGYQDQRTYGCSTQKAFTITHVVRAEYVIPLKVISRIELQSRKKKNTSGTSIDNNLKYDAQFIKRSTVFWGQRGVIR
jgi:hypothetical protein